ncbi:MAG: XRE family transcriptional regulator [Treponematales bacterium]
MPISYKPLFRLLVDRDMKKTDLISMVGLTSPIVAKFAKNEHVSGATLDKLCAFFDCQPGDIFEYVREGEK